MIKTETLKIEFTSDRFQDFLSKLKDLTQISDTVKLTIDKDNIFMYSVLGSNQLVLAVKSYQLNTNDYLVLDKELDTTIGFVIIYAKKFVKNLDFIKIDKKILAKLGYRQTEEDYAETRGFVIVNDKLKLHAEVGDDSEINNITKEKLSSLLDIDKRNWAFELSASDFSDIYKLSKINSDETKRIVGLSIKDKKVKLSEDNIWEMIVADTKELDMKFMFNKSYLAYVNQTGNPIVFNIFETFIYIENEECNLMISFEQSWD